jgi:hypothetical protein
LIRPPEAVVVEAPKATCCTCSILEKEEAEYGIDTADVTSRLLVGRTPARPALFDPYVATHRHFFILSMEEVLGVQEW